MVVDHLLTEGFNVIAATLLGGELTELNLGNATLGGITKEHFVLHHLTDIA
jgi:hypothetical protein